jgi:hypothetical protein
VRMSVIRRPSLIQERQASPPGSLSGCVRELERANREFTPERSTAKRPLNAP